MLKTYKAMLHNNTLEWEEMPELPLNQAVPVHITILEPSVAATNQERKMQRRSILEQLAQHSTIAHTSDPVAWQREQRIDRELPERK